MELLKDIRVLIVEDDSLVTEMIQGMLQDIGCIVVGKAIDGLQAIELVQQLQPDVVLMDIEMPKMDGIEATSRLQECCPVPVVMLTAYETAELVKRASAAGAGAYLVKPPNLLEIERAITITRARFADMRKVHRLNNELRARNQKLQESLAKVKTLSGLLPICANCKNIRDDQGYWQQVEEYVQKHADVEFSHGLCPDCLETLYPPDIYPYLYDE